MAKKKEINIIDNIYTDATFSGKYGLDIFLTILIIAIIAGLIGYFSVLNNLHSLRSNWNEERCKPINFPFVPMINPDPNKTASQQITDNINECVKEGVLDMASGNLDDIFNQFGLFTALKKYFDEFIKFFQEVFMWLFRTIAYIINLVLSILQKTYLGLVHIFLKAEDMFNKLLGLVVVNLYVFIQLFNMGMAFILNWASIATLMIMVPLGITIAILTTVTSLLFIISAIMFGWGIPLSAVFCAGCPAVSLAGVILGIGITVLIGLIAVIIITIIMAFVMAALIQIQNQAKRFISPTLAKTESGRKSRLRSSENYQRPPIKQRLQAAITKFENQGY